MPYRHPSGECPHERQTRLEIAAVARAARARQRRAFVGVVMIFAGGAVLVVAAIAAHRPVRPVMCHNVQIRWENAPEIPPSTWSVCRQ